MLVLHPLEVRGICWKNKCPESLLPTLQQQSSAADANAFIAVEDVTDVCSGWSLLQFWLDRSQGKRLSHALSVTGILPSLQAWMHKCLDLSAGLIWELHIGFRGLLHACWQRKLIYCIEEDESGGSVTQVQPHQLDGSVLKLLMLCLHNCSHFCQCKGIAIDCSWHIMETVGLKQSLFREQRYAAFESELNTSSSLDLCDPSTFCLAPVTAGFNLVLVDLWGEAICCLPRTCLVAAIWNPALVNYPEPGGRGKIFILMFLYY